MPSFLNRLYWFGVVGLCTLGGQLIGRASSFLNRLYWFDEVGLCTLGLNSGGPSPLCMASFLNTFYWFGVDGSVNLGLLNGQGLCISQ